MNTVMSLVITQNAWDLYHSATAENWSYSA